MQNHILRTGALANIKANKMHLSPRTDVIVFRDGCHIKINFYYVLYRKRSHNFFLFTTFDCEIKEFDALLNGSAMEKQG